MPSLLAELSLLEAELHHSGARCSRQRLEQLLHAAFHEVGRSGRVYTRDFVIEFLAAQASPPAVESNDYGVHQLDANSALLTYRSANCGADGTLTDVALRSSVWLRTAVGWQLFYHQGTPAHQPALAM